MLTVSDQYETEMKRLIRPQPFVRVVYGFVNNEAHKSSSIDSTEMIDILEDYGTKIADVINFPESFKSLASFEQDRMRIGNDMYIYDDKNEVTYDRILSSHLCNYEGIFDDVLPTVAFKFDQSQDIYGLTIAFDVINGTYSPDFTIETTNISGITRSMNITDCDSFEWIKGDLSLNGIIEMKIIINKWSVPNQRCRINKINFGVQLTFTNKEMSDSSFSHKKSMDLLSLELSSNSLQFSINNLDQSFNPLNPNGYWRYTQPNQELEVYYGMLLENDKTEWFKADTLYLNDQPKSESYKVTFNCIDRFNCMELDVYGAQIKEQYTQNGITLWDLANTIFDYYWEQTKETVEYKLDECLKDIVTLNPYMEAIDIKQALQLIANAGHCVLYCDENGVITFKNAIDPKISFEDNGHVEISNLRQAFESTKLPQYNYASFQLNYMNGDKENMIIVPDNLDELEQTGFISDKISLEDCSFQENPTIEISYSLPTSMYEIPIVFDSVGNEYATDFTLNYYLKNELIETFNVNDNTFEKYTVLNNVDSFDKLEIIINKWSKPHHRCVINSIGFGRVNDFYLDYDNAMDDPKITSFSQIQRIDINYCDKYSLGDAQETQVISYAIEDSNVIFKVGHNRMINKKIYIKNDDVETQVSGVKWIYNFATYSVFEIDKKYLSAGDIVIKGEELKNQTYVKSIEYNEKGSIKQFNNPLVSSIDNAQQISDWLHDYIAKTNTVSISYRGNPEVQPFDIIYAQSDFEKVMTCRTTKNEINFDTALSGTWEGIKL